MNQSMKWFSPGFSEAVDLHDIAHAVDSNMKSVGQRYEQLR